jgi:hypothetical protein
MSAPQNPMNTDNTLALQQQIVRLEALLEACRQIHATIQLDEVLRQALEIVVRELEMDGAFFTGFPFSHGRIPPQFLLSGTAPILYAVVRVFPWWIKPAGCSPS